MLKGENNIIKKKTKQKAIRTVIVWEEQKIATANIGGNARKHPQKIIN